MRAPASRIDVGNAVAPPLQADTAHHRLAHDLPRLGDFEVEGIERKEIVAGAAACKQGRQVAIMVVAPHLFRAVGKAACEWSGRRHGCSPVSSVMEDRALSRVAQSIFDRYPAGLEFLGDRSSGGGI